MDEFLFVIGFTLGALFMAIAVLIGYVIAKPERPMLRDRKEN